MYVKFFIHIKSCQIDAKSVSVLFYQDSPTYTKSTIPSARVHLKRTPHFQVVPSVQVLPQWGSFHATTVLCSTVFGLHEVVPAEKSFIFRMFHEDWRLSKKKTTEAGAKYEPNYMLFLRHHTPLKAYKRNWIALRVVFLLCKMKRSKTSFVWLWSYKCRWGILRGRKLTIWDQC